MIGFMPPTLATSWGTGGIIMASALLASYMEGRPVLHELTIGFAVLATVPVTLMLLGRAALYRDKAEQSPELPDILRSAALPDSGEHVESTE